MSMNVAVVAGSYKGWSCWFLKNGPVELVLVPQVGGRIMGIRWRGHDLSFTQPELEGQVVDVAAVEDLSAKKREMGFPLWGGDKTWLAPQTRWTEGAPFLDLDSGAYELAIEQAGPDLARARMTSRVCRETGVQITRTVTMKAGETAWTIDHCLTNGSAAEVEWGPWDVSMVLRTGRVYVPRSPNSTYPGGVKTDAQEINQWCCVTVLSLSSERSLSLIVTGKEVQVRRGCGRGLDARSARRRRPGSGWILQAGARVSGRTVCARCRRLGLQLGSLPLLRNGDPRSTCAFATRWAL